LTDVLVIAYSDLDGNGVPSPGDVMISQIVDTNGDGLPSAGDTIKMGQYPVAPNPTSSVQFLSWGKLDHVVVKVERSDAHVVIVRTPIGGSHQWVRDFQSQVHDLYIDGLDVEPVEHTSVIVDHYGTNPDLAHYDALCPSQPAKTFEVVSAGSGDDPLIEVDFLWGVSIL
jgi:hypothetical protein